MEFKDAAQRWNKRYREAEGFLFGTQPNGWLAGQARWLDLRAAPCLAQGRKPRVLAVADGEGRNGVWLAKQGWQVVSFDFSEVAVEKARAFAASEAVDIEINRAELGEWVWGTAQWDAVVAIFFQFADPELRDRVFPKMVTSLKPGGLLIVEGYGPRQMQHKTGGPGVLENLYTSRLLQEHLHGLEVLGWRDADAEVAEGSGHRGKSHLISAAVRKPAT